MLFTTSSQYAVLALLLIAGWFFGLASAGGGRRWRERYAAERDAHAATRREWEARHTTASGRVAELERGQDERIAAANTRVADLERENERLRSAAPQATATVAPAPARAPIVRASAARPAYPADERRGWFDWGRR